MKLQVARDPGAAGLTLNGQVATAKAAGVIEPQAAADGAWGHGRPDD